MASDPTGVNRRLALNATDALIARFWSRVAKAGDNDCWNWTAAFRNGYGAIKHEGRVHSAHRVAFVLTYDEPAAGLIVAHKCDNKACCNPAHLEAVTPAQNNRDAFARGERAEARGEQRPNAVLNEQLVSRAWSLRQSGKSYSEISRELGINHKTIASALGGKSWNHLRPKTLAG